MTADRTAMLVRALFRLLAEGALYCLLVALLLHARSVPATVLALGAFRLLGAAEGWTIRGRLHR